MPATPNRTLAQWNPGPQISGTHEFELQPDERIFSMYCEEDVAACLLETDAQIDAYRWSLTEDQVMALAFESAQYIVQQRKELLMAKQLEIARAARTSGRMAIVAGIVENLETGEITTYSREVPMGRAFG